MGVGEKWANSLAKGEEQENLTREHARGIYDWDKLLFSLDRIKKKRFKRRITSRLETYRILLPFRIYLSRLIGTGSINDYLMKHEPIVHISVLKKSKSFKKLKDFCEKEGLNLEFEDFSDFDWHPKFLFERLMGEEDSSVYWDDTGSGSNPTSSKRKYWIRVSPKENNK